MAEFVQPLEANSNKLRKRCYGPWQVDSSEYRAKLYDHIARYFDREGVTTKFVYRAKFPDRHKRGGDGMLRFIVQGSYLSQIR